MVSKTYFLGNSRVIMVLPQPSCVAGRNFKHANLSLPLCLFPSCLFLETQTQTAGNSKDSRFVRQLCQVLGSAGLVQKMSQCLKHSTPHKKKKKKSWFVRQFFGTMSFTREDNITRETGNLETKCYHAGVRWGNATR